MKQISQEVEEYQSLLFDKTSPIPPSSLPIPEKFYTHGYCILSNIHAPNSYLEQFIGSLNKKELPLLKDLLPSIQLAKHDRIPVCKDIINTGFQALHYDMGQPFIAEQDQVQYAISALWRPVDQPANPKAKTRVVSIEKLLSQISFGTKTEVQQRLIEYVRKHGDGWLTPSPHNTQRLACFARVVDAISGKNQLTEQIDTMIGQVFDYDEDLNGLSGYQQECAFFSSMGLDLNSVEEQIELHPGELLIFDNLRVVHGRIGERKARELENFIFGVKKTTPQQIHSYVEWISSLGSSPR